MTEILGEIKEWIVEIAKRSQEKENEIMIPEERTSGEYRPRPLLRCRELNIRPLNLSKKEE
jgi:hypothetical protein